MANGGELYRHWRLILSPVAACCSALGGASVLREPFPSIVWRLVRVARQFVPYIIYLNKVYDDCGAIFPFSCAAFSLFP